MHPNNNTATNHTNQQANTQTLQQHQATKHTTTQLCNRDRVRRGTPKNESKNKEQPYIASARFSSALGGSCYWRGGGNKEQVT